MKYSRKIPLGIPFDFYAYEAWLKDLALDQLLHYQIPTFSIDSFFFF